MGGRSVVQRLVRSQVVQGPPTPRRILIQVYDGNGINTEGGVGAMRIDGTSQGSEQPRSLSPRDQQHATSCLEYHIKQQLNGYPEDQPAASQG